MQTLTNDYHAILKQYWGYDSFRGIQSSIIDSICAGRDTLGLMPTGGGKSLTFQIPALASRGICIVITPLIALMKDQVVHLRQRGIKAAAIHSGMTHYQVITTLENCIFGDFKLLYISPERINSELFQAKLAHMDVSFICVDEAHCISQWGYDFRPSYLNIKQIRKLVPHAPVLALTATATIPVIADIQRQLLFEQDNVFRMSFERANLAYIVQHAEDRDHAVKQLLNEHEGSVIIYTRNRQKTKKWADKLNAWGHTATHYHARLSDTSKDDRQDHWQQDKVRIMVATNAFGMGIDKPDVRLVLHVGLPDSIESYFQEAGRAGRDGQPAKAILLYTNSDLQQLRKRVAESFPEPEVIRAIYEEVCCYLQIAIGFGQGLRREFNIMDFCTKFHRFPTIVESALRILTQADYIYYADAEEGTSRLRINYTREELYHLPNTNPHIDAILQATMRHYAGIFSDYVPIDEARLAKDTALEPVIVYQTLIALSQRHIISYIPRKNIPHITFTRDRRECKYLTLSSEVYDTRRHDMQQRIDAMIEYITQDDTCRNTYLLRYFGEEAKEPCHQCDICAEEQSVPTANDREHTRQAIIDQLTKAGSIHPFMLNFDDLDTTLAQDVLREMSADGEITTDDTFRISLTDKVKRCQ